MRALAGLIVVLALAGLLAACGPRIPVPPFSADLGPDPLLLHAQDVAASMRHATGIGRVPAVTVTLSTLTTLIRLLFIAAAGAVVCSALTGAIPFLGRIGARMFGLVAGACFGGGIACLVLSIVVTRTILWLDAHPVLTALGFGGALLGCMGVWVFGHRQVIERWTNIDWDRDGTIGA